MASRDALRRAFDVFDRDRSGKLDYNEFHAIMTRSGNGLPTLTTPHVTRLFNEFDENGDGVLNITEFINGMSGFLENRAVPDSARNMIKSSGKGINSSASRCVISFPARAGVQQWEQLVAQVPHACVWTGRKKSPLYEWFDPWKANVEKAVRLGISLEFYKIPHVQLGYGQQKEKDWLDRNGIQYTVFTILEDDRNGPSGQFVKKPFTSILNALEA